MENKIYDALVAHYAGVKESILRRVAVQLAKTVTSEDDIETAVTGALTQVLEAYGDSRATDATNTAIRNYEKKHNLKDGKAIQDGGEPTNNEPDTNTQQATDTTPAWAKALLEQNKALKERLDRMDGERITKSRKSIIEDIIKELPASTRKAYQHISFDGMSDDDFTALQDTIKTEVAEIISEQGARSTVFGRPAGGKKTPDKGATAAEVDDVVKTMHIK